MVQNPGTIQGTVYSNSPANDKIESNLDIDPECVFDNVKQRPAGALLPRVDGRLKNAVVSIEAIHQGKSFEPKNRTLSAQLCAFAPRIQWATVGTTLTANNLDSTVHDVIAKFPDESITKKVIFVSKPQSIALNMKGWVKITSENHPWMEAHVHVFEHPYATLTDFNGFFKLENVPPGTYNIKVWHEIMGEKIGRVTVYENETADHLNFQLDP
jgi:plastocyanin